MLLRSTSTRRTRAPRNAGGSPQGYAGSGVATSPPISRGRRASVATEKALGQTTIDCLMDRQRSPRGSMVPNIALDNDDMTPDEPVARRLLPDPELIGSTRGGLMPGVNRSPRNSLVPDEYCRSPRGSLVPPETGYNRSPRSSLVPGGLGHSRNSLVPTENGNSRSPTHSLLPDGGSRSPRGSMANIEFDRSPRGSICPDVSRSPRGSIAPTDHDSRSPRGSICPEMSRSPRGSIAPIEMDRTPRGSVVLEYHNQSPRGSIMPEPSRSPRGSIAPDPNRSPRGSICPDGGNRSPRGSVTPQHEFNRSPRGSVGGQPDFDRTPRGSLGGPMDPDQPRNRSPRGSIGPEIDRSPRGSLGGQERRTRALTPQDPRRASADQGTAVSRNSSPYRLREGATGAGRTAGNCGPQTNLGYGTNAWADSRRASSSVSQFSGDESRRLCGGNITSMEKGASVSGPLGVATYGTLVFQLKDAHREASGTCDFVFRAMRVVNKTMIVTVCLGCLCTMPIIMLIMGLQFIRECPKEPNIPIYMVVGGSLGSLRMFWALYSQIRSRRLELLSVPNTRPHISPMQLISIALSFFLSIWFVLGNFWILSIRWPDYEPKRFDPDHWCDKKLYVFSLIHLGIVYGAITANIITAIVLAVCRFFACPWFERYK